MPSGPDGCASRAGRRAGAGEPGEGAAEGGPAGPDPGQAGPDPGQARPQAWQRLRARIGHRGGLPEQQRQEQHVVHYTTVVTDKEFVKAKRGCVEKPVERSDMPPAKELKLIVPSSQVVLLKAQLDKDLARKVEQRRGGVDRQTIKQLKIKLAGEMVATEEASKPAAAKKVMSEEAALMEAPVVVVAPVVVAPVVRSSKPRFVQPAPLPSDRDRGEHNPGARPCGEDSQLLPTPACLPTCPTNAPTPEQTPCSAATRSPCSRCRACRRPTTSKPRGNCCRPTWRSWGRHEGPGGRHVGCGGRHGGHGGRHDA